MTKNFTKLVKIAGVALLLSVSTHSFAGGLYGSVGYGHHPVKIVIGHNGHGKHYKRERHHYNKHNKKQYYGHRYNHRQVYNYGHRANHYNPPRRYCRSRY
jgi:hypothetical protein